MHWGGYPCDMFEIKKIAKKHNLILIEDAAHALGANYNKFSIGNISDFTCFSFQAKKQLTTGDGGMLICKRKKDHIYAQKLKWFDINRKSKLSFQGERLYEISEIGYKYHLNDIASNVSSLTPSATPCATIIQSYCAIHTSAEGTILQLQTKNIGRK